jgi:hypothetical protein
MVPLPSTSRLQISQKEFLEYNLVALGYSDAAVVNLINDVHNPTPPHCNPSAHC